MPATAPSLDAREYEACVPILVITGPVGVGKTSVASEVSERLDQAGVAHALVDIDSLRWCYPRPPVDPFRIHLATQNLAAIWPNLQAAGAQRLVLTDVIESPADLGRISSAISGAEIRVVRLRATVATLTARVSQRETGLGRTRHLDRALQLAQQLDAAGVGDLVLDSDARSVLEVAEEIVIWSRWIPAPVHGTDGSSVLSGELHRYAALEAKASAII